MNPAEVTISDNQAESRYEAVVEGRMAVIEYERQADRIAFIHTEVPPELEGHGLAAMMAKRALDGARAAGLAVIPLCPYVASYIRRHQEYLDLVPEPYHERVLRREP